eukprot:1990612-Pleurochrysis_carterae.AAC.1
MPPHLRASTAKHRSRRTVPAHRRAPYDAACTTKRRSGRDLTAAKPPMSSRKRLLRLRRRRLRV